MMLLMNYKIKFNVMYLDHASCVISVHVVTAVFDTYLEASSLAKNPTPSSSSLCWEGACVVMTVSTVNLHME